MELARRSFVVWALVARLPMTWLRIGLPTQAVGSVVRQGWVLSKDD